MCEVCRNGSPARAEERILWHEQSWMFRRLAHKGVDMNCLRCAGLMVRDDLQDETGLVRFAAWRCVICVEKSLTRDP